MRCHCMGSCTPHCLSGTPPKPIPSDHPSASPCALLHNPVSRGLVKRPDPFHSAPCLDPQGALLIMGSGVPPEMFPLRTLAPESMLALLL